MQHVLLTAFAPFHGLPCNPTRRVVAELPAPKAPGLRLTSCLLPVAFAKAHSKLMEQIRLTRPAAVLCLGLDHRLVSGRDAFIRLEAVGRNRAHVTTPDNSGFAPQDQVIEPAGPSRVYLSWDAEALCGLLTRQGLPAQVSRDAGSFVCNDLIYRTCRSLQALPKPPLFGFLHIPWPDDCGLRAECRTRFQALGLEPGDVLGCRGRAPMRDILASIAVLLEAMAGSVP